MSWKEMVESVVLVGRYLPSATQTSSPSPAAARAAARLVNASVQEEPSPAPPAAASTYRSRAAVKCASAWLSVTFV